MPTPVLSELRMSLKGIRWSGQRILATVIAALGAYGLFSLLRGLLRVSSSAGPRRLIPEQTLSGLVRDYGANYATVVIFWIFLLLLAIHFTALVYDLFRRAPVPSVLAGLFIGGSVLFGFGLGLTVLKINEFAVEAVTAAQNAQPWFSAEQGTWLRGGINFLIQLHIIFVSGWFLWTGLGFGFTGWAALRSRANPRAVAVAQALAGLSMVAGVLIRIYQPADPGRQVWSLLETKLTEGGIALGLLASGILAWSAGTATSAQTVAARA